MTPVGWTAGELPGKASPAHEILSAIISHRAVHRPWKWGRRCFCEFYPSKGIAIYMRSGPRFQIEAEAGLPGRLPETLLPRQVAPKLAASPSLESPASNFAFLEQILGSGVSLCPGTSADLWFREREALSQYSNARRAR